MEKLTKATNGHEYEIISAANKHFKNASIYTGELKAATAHHSIKRIVKECKKGSIVVVDFKELAGCHDIHYWLEKLEKHGLKCKLDITSLLIAERKWENTLACEVQ